MSTADHFSSQAQQYHDFRPTYPPALFDWLAQHTPADATVWDCGCGSGQATLDLAARFGTVIGTDMSQKQLSQAQARPNIRYRCEPAEATSLADHSADLIVVAQALHWFRHDAFYAEVRRVAKPGALLVALSYQLQQVAPAIDLLVHQLYADILDGYWPPERKHVEDGYRNLPFPFARMAAPAFQLEAEWKLHQLLGYFESWSAVAAFKAARGGDPVAAMAAEFTQAWGDPERRRKVRWPLTILAGRIDAAA